MKRIKYLVLTAILFIPFSVKAATGSLQVTCSPTTAKPGDMVSCTLKGTTDGNVGSLAITIAESSNLALSGFTNSTGWNGELVGKKISLYNADEVTGTFDIGTLKVKVSDNATVGTANLTFSQITFNSDVANTTTKVDNKEVNITISEESQASGLKSLTPTVGMFGGQFTTDNSGYLLTIPGSATTFGFTYEPVNAGDTVKFFNSDTNQELDPSNITFATSGGNAAMLIRIEVGAGDSKTDYSVAVKKEVQEENKGYELSKLTVGDQEVSLVSGQYEYTVTLNNTTSYKVTADLKDRTNYQITNLIEQRTGEGSFTIIVAPKDNSSGLQGQTYTINVKGSGNSSNSSSSSKPSSVAPAPSYNPPTGGALSVIVALVLAASFGASIYFYKKNMGYFSK